MHALFEELVSLRRTTAAVFSASVFAPAFYTEPVGACTTKSTHTHARAGKKHKRSQTWVGRCRLPSDGLNAKQRLVRPCAAVMGRDSIDIASVRARPTRNLRVATAATRWDSAPSLSPENS